MTLLSAMDAEAAAMLCRVSGFGRKFDDHYTIVERLHAGAYGTVYRVTDRQHPAKDYAAKIIQRRKLKKQEDKDVISEADIMRDLSGMEGVVEYVDFFAEEDTFYIIQGLARGGDVFERIARRELYGEHCARSVMIKLLRTVKKLHELDIIHRDLKLENLLLSDPRDKTSILVADFGFATYVPEEGYATRRCGTPAYVSPQVWKKQPYGKDCDMWSVGCILYMLLDAGRAPFSGSDNKKTCSKACKGDLKFEGRRWDSVSEEAKQLIRGLLAVDPNERWTAEEALQSTWIQSGLADALFQNLDWVPDCSEKRDRVGRSYIYSVVPIKTG